MTFTKNDFRELLIPVRGAPSAKLGSKRPACPPKLAKPEGLDKRRLGRTTNPNKKEN